MEGEKKAFNFNEFKIIKEINNDNFKWQITQIGVDLTTNIFPISEAI